MFSPELTLYECIVGVEISQYLVTQYISNWELNYILPGSRHDVPTNRQDVAPSLKELPVLKQQERNTSEFIKIYEHLEVLEGAQRISRYKETSTEIFNFL